MYFYLLLFFSKAIFWGEDWDPQKMLGTPIWSDMWVPGPRMKNPSAIPAVTLQTVFFRKTCGGNLVSNDTKREFNVYSSNWKKTRFLLHTLHDQKRKKY